MTQALIESKDPLSPRPVVSRELVITVGAWVAIALVATGLRLTRQFVAGERVMVTQAMLDLWMIAQWAAATPFVLRSARGLPVRAPHALRNGFMHLAIGTAYIVASNVLIRIPMLWTAEHGLAALERGTLLGLVTYYPTAIISYCVLVAIGHRAFAEREEKSPVPDASPELLPELSPESDDNRLIVREWNRVHFIALDDIEWIEADNNHVVVHARGRTYKGRERIGDVQGRLDPRRFVRVHRSAIVPLGKIREVQPLMHGDQAIVLHSGRVVRVARGRRRALESALGTEL